MLLLTAGLVLLALIAGLLSAAWPAARCMASRKAPWAWWAMPASAFIRFRSPATGGCPPARSSRAGTQGGPVDLLYRPAGGAGSHPGAGLDRFGGRGAPLSDAIFVSVVEKRPFALWQTPPDAKGEAKSPCRAFRRRHHHQGTDKFSKIAQAGGRGGAGGAADLVDAVMSHRAVSARTAAYERVSGRRWNLILNDGVVVKLPETGWQKELDALEHLIVDNGILERDVTEIDLPLADAIFLCIEERREKRCRTCKET